MNSTTRTSSSRYRRYCAGIFVAGALVLASVCAWVTISELTAADARTAGSGGAVDAPPTDGRGADDGEISADQPLSVDSTEPALARLNPELTSALRGAAAAAEADGITLRVTSGWRSVAYQDRLLAQAIADYGSREEASRWVASADRSAHVQGIAVDIGPTDAYSWLEQHGAQWGLCRIFANEGWHFEKRDLDENGYCPQQLPSAADDPRQWTISR